MGVENNSLTPIILTNKIYESSEAREIECYFHKRFTELNLVENEITSEIRREFLSKKLKLPLGLKLEDVNGFLNDSKPFKKLISNDFIIAGVAMERFIIDGSKKFNILNTIPKKDRCVYAIELNEKVKGDKEYKKYNPDWDIEKPAYYIGQTAKSRQERYNQHITGIKSNRYVRKYAVVPFENSDKTIELSELFAVPVDNLRYYQALYYEQKLTLLLQEKGFGAYSK